jgi:hypothetical protein
MALAIKGAHDALAKKRAGTFERWLARILGDT